MKEQFVTYEIALKLKELRFDEECFDSYYKELPEYGKNTILWKYGDDNFSREIWRWSEMCNAPLWQQAIDWLYETYLIDVTVIPVRFSGEKNIYFQYRIVNFNDLEFDEVLFEHQYNRCFNLYSLRNEAYSAAFDYILNNNLI